MKILKNLKCVVMWKKILLLSLAIMSGFSIFYFNEHKIENNSISLKARYQGYACGDCHPQFKVIDVSENGNFLESELLGKEIFVKYSSKRIEKSIDAQTVDCAICFTFSFKGRLKRSKNYYVLLAREASVFLGDEKCCYD